MIQDEYINEMIAQNIYAQVLTKLDSIIERKFKETGAELVQQELKHQQDLFYNKGFLEKITKLIISIAEQEVRQQLSQEGLKEYIRDISKETILEGLKSNISYAAEKAVDKINLKLRRELEITNTLMQQIDCAHNKIYSAYTISDNNRLRIVERIQAELNNLLKVGDEQKAIQYEEVQ